MTQGSHTSALTHIVMHVYSRLAVLTGCPYYCMRLRAMFGILALSPYMAWAASTPVCNASTTSVGTLHAGHSRALPSTCVLMCQHACVHCDPHLRMYMHVIIGILGILPCLDASPLLLHADSPGCAVCRQKCCGSWQLRRSGCLGTSAWRAKS